MSKAVWFPTEDQVTEMKLYRLMKKHGITDYDEFHKRSIQDTAWFWRIVEEDMELDWFQPYRQVKDSSDGVPWTRWFVDGKINVAHNCLDRFVKDPVARHRLALIWEGDDGEVRKLTYQELWKEVNALANGLRKLDVRRGDRIAIYLPMVAENVITMLAAARIGAVFTPCFSGYGADAVATRLRDCEAKVLVTADGFLRRGKVIPMKEEADQAADLSPSVEKVVVVNRLRREDCPRNGSRDVDWADLVTDSKALPSEVTDADTPFMIIYTSGTTGRPKGTVHVHAGFPVKSGFDAGYSMDVKAGDILFWMTDMGWMMGPWMVFGALMNGATMLLFEGTPDYPEPDRLWKLVDAHGVTHWGVSDGDPCPDETRGELGPPTRSEQSEGVWLHRRTLESRTVAVVVCTSGQKKGSDLELFRRNGDFRGILAGNLMKPIAPCSFNGPVPGMDVEVLNGEGQPIRGEVGELVIRQPWVGMTSGFWRDPQRYEEAYWNRWPDQWVHGDWVLAEDEGFWYITGRSDDTLKIAGKRLGPAEVESILVDHAAVLEAATIGVPDPDKGEAAVCFAVLKPGFVADEELKQELMTSIAEKMGKALRPKEIHFVSDLPKTRNGKILRRAIKAAYTGKEAGDLSSLENPQAVEAVRSVHS